MSSAAVLFGTLRVNITCSFNILYTSSNGMKSAQMRAITEFHTINPCNVCSVVLDEIRDKMKTDETINCVFLHTLHFI